MIIDEFQKTKEDVKKVLHVIYNMLGRIQVYCLLPREGALCEEGV